MEYVLYNGKCFCCMSDTGKISKSDLLKRAYRFNSPNSARNRRTQAPTKLEGFCVYGINPDGNIFKVTNVRDRKKFSRDVRKLIYNKADGKCALCGRKISYKDMTLDHVIPLALGGADEVENLQSCCAVCNCFKGSVLPDEFMERITDIYMYQMEKKYNGSIWWKITNWMLTRKVN